MSNRLIVAGDTLKVEALVWSVVGLQAEWGPATSFDWYHKLINNHKVCACTNLKIERSLLSLSPLLSVVHVERSRCHMSSCPQSQCPNMHSYTAGGDSKHHGEEQGLSTCTWEPPKQKFLGSMLQSDDNLEQKRLFRRDNIWAERAVAADLKGYMEPRTINVSYHEGQKGQGTLDGSDKHSYSSFLYTHPHTNIGYGYCCIYRQTDTLWIYCWCRSALSIGVNGKWGGGGISWVTE